MLRPAVNVIAVLAAVVAAGAALAADQSKVPAAARVQANQLPSLQQLQNLQIHPQRRLTIRERPPGAQTASLFQLWPTWNQSPTSGSGADFGGSCGINGWIYDWGVKNVGGQTSQNTNLVLTCELVGGGPWPAGQLQFLQDRLCGCMGRTFYLPGILAHTTYGFGNPNGFRLRTFQGLDSHPCNDPQYPHAKVTVKITGQGSATVELCQ